MQINFTGNEEQKQRIKLSKKIKKQLGCFTKNNKIDMKHILIEKHKEEVISNESFEY